MNADVGARRPLSCPSSLSLPVLGNEDSTPLPGRTGGRDGVQSANKAACFSLKKKMTSLITVQ